MPSRKAFTLLELIAVIAVISILTAMLLPALSSARQYLLKVKTQTQLHRYIQAYHAFQAEYGVLPAMGRQGSRFELHGNNAVFIQTLSGRKQAGEPSDHPEAQKANPRRIVFHAFSEEEFAAPESPFTGEIVDAFGNPHIVIVIDEDGDGLIPAGDLPKREQALHASVAIYTEQGTQYEGLTVHSW